MSCPLLSVRTTNLTARDCVGVEIKHGLISTLIFGEEDVGRNGYGAKLANTFRAEFVVECIDAV